MVEHRNDQVIGLPDDTHAHHDILPGRRKHLTLKEFGDSFLSDLAIFDRSPFWFDCRRPLGSIRL
jgi:hypothetical protein